jgi:hypothetical protein
MYNPQLPRWLGRITVPSLGSALATYETLTFGYVTQCTWLPKALLLSTRIAPVTVFASIAPRENSSVRYG